MKLEEVILNQKYNFYRQYLVRSCRSLQTKITKHCGDYSGNKSTSDGIVTDIMAPLIIINNELVIVTSNHILSISNQYNLTVDIKL